MSSFGPGYHNHHHPRSPSCGGGTPTSSTCSDQSDVDSVPESPSQHNSYMFGMCADAPESTKTVSYAYVNVQPFSFEISPAFLADWEENQRFVEKCRTMKKKHISSAGRLLPKAEIHNQQQQQLSPLEVDEDPAAMIDEMTRWSLLRTPYLTAAAPGTGEAPFVSGSTSPPIASSIPTVSAASPTPAKPSPTTAKPSPTTAKRSASSSSRRAGASAPKRPRKASTPPLKPPKSPSPRQVKAEASPAQPNRQPSPQPRSPKPDPVPVWNCERLEELAGPGPWRTTKTLKSLLTFDFVDKEGAIDAHVDLIERIHQAGVVFHHEELPVRSPLDNSPTPYSDVIISRKPAKQGKIKRPMNCFMLWAKGQRLYITQARPDLHNAAVSKHLGAVWKRINKEIHIPFKVESQRLQKLHKEEYPNYKYAPQKNKSKQSKKAAAATVTRTESGRVSKKPVREPASAAAPDTTKVKTARARKAAGGGGSGRKAKTSAATTTPNVSAEVNRCLQSMLQSGPQRHFQHLQVPATATATTTTTTGKSFSRLLIDEDFKKGVRDSQKVPSCAEVTPPAAEGDVGGLCNGLPPLSFPVEDASTMVASMPTPPSQHNYEGAVDVDVGGFVPVQQAASSSSTGGLQQLTAYTPQQQPPAYQEDAGVPGLAPLDSISDLRDLAVEPLTASWNEDVKFESISMEDLNSFLDHVDNNGDMIVDFVTDEDVTHVTENVPENMFA